MELTPGQTIDRYVVEAPLGRGGMAVVYRVRHTQLDTLHALKLLSVPSWSIRERLLQEGRVQAQLKHKNVLAVSDVLDVEGSPGLLMEYVRGPSLDRVLETGKLPLHLVDSLVTGILAGVNAAHAHGVVHRDLKPANVLLAMQHGQVVPKVADFGLVKLFTDGQSGDAKTRSGAAMGTPEYMSPEQIRSARDVDLRTDIFALGAMMYELVVGERPFKGDDLIELFNQIGNGTYRPVVDSVPDVPARMLAAIEGALKVDVDERLQDCEALWKAWSGPDSQPLMVAAATSVSSWDPDLIETIEALSHKVGEPIDSSETGDWFSGSQPPALTPAPVAAQPTSTPTIGAGGIAALSLFGIGAGVLGLALLVGAAVYLQPWASEAPEAVAVIPAPAEAPERPRTPVRPEPIEDEVVEVTEPAPEPTPQAPSPAPRPALVAEPEPAPAPQDAPAQVSATGDAEDVRLIALDGTVHPLGSVPAGKYVVEAVFGGEATRTITLDLAEEQQVTLSCKSDLRFCAIR